jgi:tetratricopeptide (TPR) repeat protein
MKMSDDTAEYLSKRGISLIHAGNQMEAVDLFKQAIAVDACFMPAYNNLALALIEEGDHASALPIAEHGLEIDQAYIPLYAPLLLALKYLGRAEEAIPYLCRAVAIKGDDPQLLSNLGSLLAESGETTEALQIFEKVVAFDPPYIPAYHMLSVIKEFERRDDAVTAMERLLTQGIAPQDEAILHYALGKAYEDLKIYDVSFYHYKAANDLSRQSFQYDIAEDREFFAQIKQTFTADFIRSHRVQVREQTPIFIVGIPRSGTSLVEQMLASHPDLYAAGELNTLDWLQFGHLGMTKNAYAAKMQTMAAADFQNISQIYLERLHKGATGKAFFTDKMPLNFR